MKITWDNVINLLIALIMPLGGYAQGQVTLLYAVILSITAGLGVIKAWVAPSCMGPGKPADPAPVDQPTPVVTAQPVTTESVTTTVTIQPAIPTVGVPGKE